MQKMRLQIKKIKIAFICKLAKKHDWRNGHRIWRNRNAEIIQIISIKKCARCEKLDEASQIIIPHVSSQFEEKFFAYAVPPFTERLRLNVKRFTSLCASILNPENPFAAWDGYTFRIWNGLTATIRQAKNPEAVRILNLCEKVLSDPTATFASPTESKPELIITVSIGAEQIHLIPYAIVRPAFLIKSIMYTEEWFVGVRSVVYGDVAYSLPSNTYEVLLDALKTKSNPKIHALLHSNLKT